MEDKDGAANRAAMLTLHHGMMIPPAGSHGEEEVGEGDESCQTSQPMVAASHAALQSLGATPELGNAVRPALEHPSLTYISDDAVVTLECWASAASNTNNAALPCPTPRPAPGGRARHKQLPIGGFKGEGRRLF